MKVFAVIGTAVLVFLFAVNQSLQALDNADIPPVDVSGKDDESILNTTPDRQKLLRALGEGIARGEGYYSAQSKPMRLNNPGDLKVGGVIIEFAKDSSDLPLPGGGWNALFRQLNMNLNGSSHVYDLTMNLKQMCATWTALSDGIELDNYTQEVIDSLNSNGYAATADTTIGALARGDFSA